MQSPEFLLTRSFLVKEYLQLWCHRTMKMEQNEAGFYPNWFPMAVTTTAMCTEPWEIHLA